MRVPLSTVLREWGRIGLIGFGGPPAHISLLQRRVVDERGWLKPDEFEAAIAACNLLPGPASTQLAIFCAYRVAGRAGAVIGGLAFILPAVVCVVLLSLLFLASSPPLWIRGAGDGAGAAVAAVAVSAGWALLKPSWHKARSVDSARVGRWGIYVAMGAAGAVGRLLLVGLRRIDLVHQLDLGLLEEPVEVLDVALVQIDFGERRGDLAVRQYTGRLSLRDEELDLLQFLKFSY